MTDLGRANANASRAFFVRMLTRDISVEDCILDLIDNSVDSAWKSLGKQRLGLDSGPDFSKCKVHVDFDEEHFVIRDNSGGMTLDSAKQYAFTFGRIDHDPNDTGEFSIGVYGIGLKRAIFKIGQKIHVRSTTAGKSGDSFEVPINVKDWVKDDSTDWDFPILASPRLEASGVEISVEDLTDLARVTFQDTEFEGKLSGIIGRDYALHIKHGLKIFVNGIAVKGEDFKLFSGDGFEPQNLSYEDSVNGETIRVDIVAGFAFPPPDSNEPQERGVREDKSGWYVACNGRIVMAADKSSLSVWGDDFPAWHPQYTGFFGLVIFTADNTELLPLTTTKRNVDLSSVVYRRARPNMRPPTRAWIDYTNARKSQQDEAKAAEAKAEQTSIFAIKPQAQVQLPTLTRTKRQTTSIQFSVLKTRVKNLARELGDVRMSNGEVGRKAFDHTYSDLVGDDE